MRALAISLVCLALALPGAGVGQDTSVSIPPPVLTIDQDRLFSETQPGLKISDALEERASALAAENEDIQNTLIEEERELTNLRGTMRPEEFTALADTFDQKVQRIRAEQDQKAREINEEGEAARQQFFNDIAAIISAIVLEKGALIVFDRREVFLSADRIDITDEAIERVNEATEN